MDGLPSVIDLSSGWRWSASLADFQHMASADWPALPEVRPLWLMRRFDVPPITTHCLRYHLHLDGLPVGSSLAVNHLQLDDIPATSRFDCDITDHITLQDNVLIVTLHSDGIFRSVWLDFTFCDDL